VIACGDEGELAKIGLIPVVAVLLMTLAIESLSTVSVRAEENCLAAPSGRPPQGSHWYYRTDPIKQSKCWYLRTEGEAIQKPGAQEKPETGVIAKLPAAATPKTSGSEAQQLPPLRVAQPALGGRSTQDNGQVSRQAADSPVPWPDPRSPAGAGNVAWPDPPVSAVSTTQGATAERASQKQELPATAENSDKVKGNGAAGDRQVGERTETAVSDNEMPDGMLLALAIALVIAGICVRQTVRMIFARRHIVRPDRRKPVWSTIARKRTTSEPVAHRRDLAPGWVDRLDDDVKEALRKHLRTLDRQAA
jgi:hypothetical protein